MKTVICLLGLLAMTSIACSPSPKSGRGFTLPEGNALKGEATYVRLECNACHTIDGVEQLNVGGNEPALSVALGGSVSRIQTYGELVTSVINPSHRLAKGYESKVISQDGSSKMKNYNDVMTIAELTDVVAFLQSKYELIKYDPTHYPTYGPYGPY